MRGTILLCATALLCSCAGAPPATRGSEDRPPADEPSEEPEEPDCQPSDPAAQPVADEGHHDTGAPDDRQHDAGTPGEVATSESSPDDEELGEIADDVEEDEPLPAEKGQPFVHPFADLSQRDLEKMFVQDRASLGSISVGRPNAGVLFNGVQMPESERWIVRTPNFAWGTQETVDAIIRCIDKVNDQFPDTPKLYIGHLSRKNGGRFPPHRSHQSGRDVDLGYYYSTDDPWYSRAHAKNLDRARSWALVRAIITETDVQYIFINHSVQALLREHALSIGEDPHWLDQVFGGKTATLRPIIRHAPGHATHIHVRFFNPIAQETGRRLYPLLVKHKVIRPPTFYVYHRVRKGQTLCSLARRYRTSIRAIRRANRMRSNMLRAGKVYKIPRSGGVPRGLDEPIAIPPRRLPPAPSQENPPEDPAVQEPAEERDEQG